MEKIFLSTYGLLNLPITIFFFIFANLNPNIIVLDLFFLKIEGGGFNYVSMINKIQDIRMVQSSYLVNLKSPKSKYNLIFE